MAFARKEIGEHFAKFEQIVKTVVGADGYNQRLENAMQYLNKPNRIYRDSDDLLFLYMVLFRAWLDENTNIYNLFEGARIVPVMVNIVLNSEIIHSIVHSDNKLEELCNAANENVDGTMFEILVALSYYKSGYEEVGYMPTTPGRKTPDIYAKKGSSIKHVECKKLRRGNDYSYKEIDTWYHTSELIKRVIVRHRISGFFEFKFVKELVGLNANKVLRKFERKVSRMAEKPFIVSRSEDFVIKYTPIRKNKFEVDLDPLRNVSGPSFVFYLTDTYDQNCGYKVLAECEREGMYASKVHWGSVLSWNVTGYQSIKKKAQQIKWHIVAAQKQLLGYEGQNIHTLIEECHGGTVYRARLARNIQQILGFVPDAGFTGNIYVHSAKYLVPLNEEFDVEETIQRFGYKETVPDIVPPCWFYYDRQEDGYGELYQDHPRVG